MKDEESVLDDGSPLFLQIGAQLADDIADGTLAEGERVPSSNEFAAYYRINPATAAKGINMLIDQGLLEKRRGIGMFVSAGARERLPGRAPPALCRAVHRTDAGRGRRLGMDTADLVSLIPESSQLSGKEST